MDIVIVANFTMDFSETDNGRFSYLANLLSEHDEVEVITSDFYHITKAKRESLPNCLPYKVTFLKEPGYPKNICLKRFYSHKKWAKEVKRYLNSRKRPDVIYASVPSLDAALYTAKYCRRNHIKFVIDIQDLWPEAFQMVLHIPFVSNILFWPFKAKANGIYKRADAICGVSETYVGRALQVNQRCKSGTVVYLGTELSRFDEGKDDRPILKKSEGEIWVAYCGTLGASYDLTCVIDALALIDEEKLCFVVMGDGPRMDEFVSYAKQKKVRTEFVGRLNYRTMSCLLSACDITVNPITHLAPQSIINKHADYAASGLPVVSTQENEEYKHLVEEYRMGFNCNNNDASDMSRKIKRLIEDDELRLSMGKNARKCAEERFDRKTSYSLLVNAILK